MAATKGRAEVTDVVIEARTDLELEDNDCNPPLHNAAAAQGYDAIVRTLIRAQARVDSTDDLRQTLLHWAAAAGDFEIVKTLLARGGSAHCANDWGDTRCIAQGAAATPRALRATE